MAIDSNHRFAARNQRGATLIELMIALLLGLVVVAAASGLFLTNKRVYASTETINRIQENTRVAFELMSRDVREAGGNPCGTNSMLANQLTTAGTPWWMEYSGGIRGYGAGDATAGTVRAAGTHALDLHLAGGEGIQVVEHDNPSANLRVTDATGVAAGDVLMVCNTEISMIFMATGVNSAGGGIGIQHNGGNTGYGAQNCGQEFQYQGCAPGASSGNGYCFLVNDLTSINPNCSRYSQNPAHVARVETFRWYVAENGRGGRSLYRARLVNRTADVTPDIVEPVEVAEGIVDLQLRYRIAGDSVWRVPSPLLDWASVNAVKIELVAEGADGALSGGYLQGTDGTLLSRTSTHVVALRNREGVL